MTARWSDASRDSTLISPLARARPKWCMAESQHRCHRFPRFILLNEIAGTLIRPTESKRHECCFNVFVGRRLLFLGVVQGPGVKLLLRSMLGRLRGFWLRPWRPSRESCLSLVSLSQMHPRLNLLAWHQPSLESPHLYRLVKMDLLISRDQSA